MKLLDPVVVAVEESAEQFVALKEHYWVFVIVVLVVEDSSDS